MKDRKEGGGKGEVLLDNKLDKEELELGGREEVDEGPKLKPGVGMSLGVPKENPPELEDV